MPDSLQFLRCHAASAAYGFDAGRVRGVHRWEAVAPPPHNAPEGSVGVLDGVPVFPLPHLLGLAAAVDAGRGPVVRFDDLAVQVDHVLRPESVPLSEFRSLPAVTRGRSGAVQGLVRLAGELTLCVDAARLRGEEGHADPEWPTEEPWEGAMSGDTRRLLCFLPPGSGDKTFFAVSYRQVVEVAQGLALTRLRSANPCLVGLLDWRQRAVPVVDLGVLLGVGSTADHDAARVLIARSPRGKELFAFPARHMAPVSLPLPEDSIVTRILEPPSRLIRAAYGLNDDGFLFVPDLEKMAAA